jgi:hypothetical protein
VWNFVFFFAVRYHVSRIIYYQVKKVCEKMSQTNLSNISWTWWYKLITPATWETEAGNFKFNASLQNSARPSQNKGEGDAAWW